MEVTIKTDTWTVRIYDAETKDWFYVVLSGNPTTRQVAAAKRKIG